MHVVVCVKQVPDTTNVRINPKTNTLMREGVESIVNPFDEYALEQGLLLKDRHGARLTVISMGPPQATAVLREALARGADEAFLVSSRAFGGADTLATSYTLSQAIRKACGGVPDIVLFGKQAIDGDTAQVGPGVSEFLGVPLVTYVKELEVRSDGPSATYRVVTVMDEGTSTIEGRLPADDSAEGCRCSALRSACRRDPGGIGQDHGPQREGCGGRSNEDRAERFAHESCHHLSPAGQGMRKEDRRLRRCGREGDSGVS